MFLTLLKLRKEKKKGGGAEEMRLFEPYFANDSFSPRLKETVPSCNSPHIFMG